MSEPAFTPKSDFLRILLFLSVCPQRNDWLIKIIATKADSSWVCTADK